MDRQNIIKGLNEIGAFITGRLEYGQAKNFLEFLDEAIALLKEQEDLGTELTNAIELIHKKNERIKKLEEQIETLTKWRANAGAFD